MCPADALGACPSPRSSHKAAAWRDAMLVFGGHSGEGGERLGDLHTLRQVNGKWTWSQEHQPAIGRRPAGALLSEVPFLLPVSERFCFSSEAPALAGLPACLPAHADNRAAMARVACCP